MDLFNCVIQDPIWVWLLDSEAQKEYIDSIVGFGRPGHLLGISRDEEHVLLYSGCFVNEDAHLCIALMPIMGDYGLLKASVLFVEFKEMKFCMVTI